MKSEWIARIVLIMLLAAAGLVSALALVGPAEVSSRFARLAGSSSGNENVIELHARMPENGGWSEQTLYAQVGVPLHLRMTSDDVLHSFALGQSDRAPLDLTPGEWAETTLVFDKPGRYTFYCTHWCGRNHWRMRGTIEVGAAPDAVDSSADSLASAGAGAGEPSQAAAQEKPLYLRLGLDVDAPHTAAVAPAQRPSAERGAALVAAARLPAWALDRQVYLENSPAALWQRLRAEASLKDLSDADLWDALAYLLARQSTPAELAQAAQLYATNCAACHGETGKGDGVMVEGLPRYVAGQTHSSPTSGGTTAGGGAMPVTTMPGTRMPGITMPGMDSSEPGGVGASMGLSAPPDFTDPRILLGASPALLQGKLLRGGMGTGMPYWGPIFTNDQLDALIAYLYGFALER